jgi:hypothetical protein
MKLDAVYDADKDRIIISYQETPASPVTTIDMPHGHEHFLEHALFDFVLRRDFPDGWEYHVRDEDKHYGT